MALQQTMCKRNRGDSKLTIRRMPYFGLTRYPSDEFDKRRVPSWSATADSEKTAEETFPSLFLDFLFSLLVSPNKKAARYRGKEWVTCFCKLNAFFPVVKWKLQLSECIVQKLVTGVVIRAWLKAPIKALCTEKGGLSWGSCLNNKWYHFISIH